MADLKISQLAGATTPLAGTEVLPIVQSGATKQVSVANLTAGRIQTSNGIVQGSTATGYNFTANTPAAGMTSQLLNWYEEGTWTPTVNFGAGNTGMTVTTSGHYTRVGRQVTVRCTVSFTAKGSSTGTFRILGLPFNANTPGAGVMGFNYAWTTMPSGGVSFLATSDSIYAMAANSGSYMDDTYFGNSTVINDITITYMV